MLIQSNPPAKYTTDERLDDDAIIAKAKMILCLRLAHDGYQIDSPQKARDYIMINLAQHEQEVFYVMYLTAQHQIIEFKHMFSGTLAQCAVYPREIVKHALKINAGAVILAHNHPSGDTTPSNADKRITSAIKDALQLVDIRTLDHVIVGGGNTYSMLGELSDLF